VRLTLYKYLEARTSGRAALPVGHGRWGRGPASHWLAPSRHKGNIVSTGPSSLFKVSCVFRLLFVLCALREEKVRNLHCYGIRYAQT
jgi:hypothetical protein